MLVGQTYKNFTVTAELDSFASVEHGQIQMVEVQCLCDKKHIIRFDKLKTRHFKCGCNVEKIYRKIKWKSPKKKTAPKPRPRKDYRFQQFGKLFVLADLEDRISPTGKRYRVVQVECDCGNTTAMLLSSILQGRSHCGCESRRKQVNTQPVIPNLIRVEYQG